MSTNGTSPRAFRIAVVGGGLGGLFTALAIHHHCTKTNASFQIDIYEQAAEYREIGAGIGCRLFTAQLIHNIGLGHGLNAIAGDAPCLSCRRYDNSGEIVSIPNPPRGDVRVSPCARSELLELFVGAIGERKAARLHTGKACTRVEDLGESVRIHFADKTTADADLVIGSDGIHSNVRRQFVADDVSFSGFIAYRAVVPIASLPPLPYPSWTNSWLAKHRHFLTYAISANKSLNIVAFVTTTEDKAAGTKESWSSMSDRSDVERDFEGFDWYVQEIIKVLPEKVPKWKINEHRTLDRWHYLDGKVVLLGDAAHAMSPHLGAGFGVAIADGWILARGLSEYLSGSSFRDLQSVAEVYQASRAPPAQLTNEMSRANGNSVEMQAPEMMDKSYDECVVMLAEGVKMRLGATEGDTTDELYEKARDTFLSRV